MRIGSVSDGNERAPCWIAAKKKCDAHSPCWTRWLRSASNVAMCMSLTIKKQEKSAIQDERTQITETMLPMFLYDAHMHQSPIAIRRAQAPLSHSRRLLVFIFGGAWYEGANRTTRRSESVIISGLASSPCAPCRSATSFASRNAKKVPLCQPG